MRKEIRINDFENIYELCNLLYDDYSYNYPSFMVCTVPIETYLGYDGERYGKCREYIKIKDTVFYRMVEYEYDDGELVSISTPIITSLSDVEYNKYSRGLLDGYRYFLSFLYGRYNYEYEDVIPPLDNSIEEKILISNIDELFNLYIPTNSNAIILDDSIYDSATYERYYLKKKKQSENLHTFTYIIRTVEPNVYYYKDINNTTSKVRYSISDDSIKNVRVYKKLVLENYDDLPDIVIDSLAIQCGDKIEPVSDTTKQYEITFNMDTHECISINSNPYYTSKALELEGYTIKQYNPKETLYLEANTNHYIILANFDNPISEYTINNITISSVSKYVKIDSDPNNDIIIKNVSADLIIEVTDTEKIFREYIFGSDDVYEKMIKNNINKETKTKNVKVSRR